MDTITRRNFQRRRRGFLLPFGDGGKCGLAP